MPPGPGTTLLHYRLAERIGVGGMGEVWRAEDTTLGRDVAIKILPAEVADNEDRVARFEREARTLAALQHPNVASIYGAHHVDGVRFLAMEHVPGEDLAERLARGALDTDEALAIGRSVALGLAAAHERGIVHRDLKPANVKLAPDGTVKVLDFGLARALSAPGDSSSAPTHPTLSPTVTSDRTVPGVVLGTAAYMSPEQARGRTVDRRTDLWAFGCLLYELLTGRRAFDGETVSDTLAAVLRAEPDLDALPADVSPRIRRLVARCLAKDVERRWRDAGDVALEIDDAAADPAAGGAEDAGAPRSGAGRLAIGAVAGALVVAVAFVVAGYGDGEVPAPRVVEAQLPFSDVANPTEVRIAPDGSVVAAVGRAWATGDPKLELRRLDREDLIAVDVDLYYDDVCFSPDSSQVAFVVADAPGLGRAALVRMPADGSAPPVPVTPWEFSWAERVAWLDDGTLLASDWSASEVVVISTDTGRERRSIEVAYEDGGEVSLMPHDVLPDGRVLATVSAWDGGYHQDVVLLDLADGRVTRILDRAFLPRFVAPDVLVFARGDRLYVVGFDPDSGRAFGDERVVRSGLRTHVEATVTDYDLSRRGDLVYLDGGVIGDRRRLVRVDAEGVAVPLVGDEAPFAAGEIDDSQDGSVIAVVKLSASGLYTVWATSTDDAVLRPIFDFPGMDCDDPTVSPTGDLIVASCLGDDERDGLWVAPFPPDGTAPVRVLRGDRRHDVSPRTWLPDGRRLFLRRSVDNRRSVEILDVAAGPDSAPVVVSSLASTDVASMAVSPDGRLAAWIAWAPNGAGELRLAPWLGDDVGPFRPVGSVRATATDWNGRAAGVADGWILVVVRDDGSFERLVVDGQGRVRGRTPHEIANRISERSIGMALISDGGVVYIERDPREAEPNAVRIVTDWLTTIR